jgi:hypothetical protein
MRPRRHREADAQMRAHRQRALFVPSTLPFSSLDPSLSTLGRARDFGLCYAFCLAFLSSLLTLPSSANTSGKAAISSDLLPGLDAFWCCLQFKASLLSLCTVGANLVG